MSKEEYLTSAKGKAEHLYDDAKEKMENSAQQGKENYDALKDKAEETYQKIKASASDFYEDGKKKIENAQNYLEEHSDEIIKAIKERPLTSLLIAGGIGFILAGIFNKK